MNYIFFLLLYLFVNVQEIKGKSDYIYTPSGRVKKEKDEEKSTFQSFKDMLGRNWKKVLVGILAAGGGAYALKNHLDNNKNLILNQGNNGKNGNRNSNMMGGMSSNSIVSGGNIQLPASQNTAISKSPFLLKIDNLKNLLLTDSEIEKIKNIAKEVAINQIYADDKEMFDYNKNTYESLIQKINTHNYINTDEFKKDLLLLDWFRHVGKMLPNEKTFSQRGWYVKNYTEIIQNLWEKAPDVFKLLSIEEDFLKKEDSGFGKVFLEVFPLALDQEVKQKVIPLLSKSLCKSVLAKTKLDVKEFEKECNPLQDLFIKNKAFLNDAPTKLICKIIESYFYGVWVDTYMRFFQSNIQKIKKDYGNSNMSEVQKIQNIRESFYRELFSLDSDRYCPLYEILEEEIKQKHKINDPTCVLFNASTKKAKEALVEKIMNYPRFKNNKISVYETLRELLENQAINFQAMLEREKVENFAEYKYNFLQKVIEETPELKDFLEMHKPSQKLYETATEFYKNKNKKKDSNKAEYFMFNNKKYFIKETPNKIARVYNAEKLKNIIQDNNIAGINVPEKYIIVDKNYYDSKNDGEEFLMLITEYIPYDTWSNHARFTLDDLKKFIKITELTKASDYIPENFTQKDNKGDIYFIDTEDKTFLLDKKDNKTISVVFSTLNVTGSLNQEAQEFYKRNENKNIIAHSEIFDKGRNEFSAKANKIVSSDIYDFDKEPTV